MKEEKNRYSGLRPRSKTVFLVFPWFSEKRKKQGGGKNNRKDLEYPLMPF